MTKGCLNFLAMFSNVLVWLHGCRIIAIVETFAGHLFLIKKQTILPILVW